MLSSRGGAVPEFPAGDPLDDATVLVAGRGRSYPALSTAIGEHAGLIGALSLETAARCLKSRDIDGIVIGDGFSARMLEAFLTVVAEDARFRDLPIAMLHGAAFNFDGELPNFAGFDDPEILVDHFLPFARLHAFEMRVKRMLKSLDAEGLLDPATGLLTEEAFLRELNRALRDSGHRGVGLSIARFSFPEQRDRRTNLDAARLVSGLVRNIDFGCRDDDGSIVVVFTETDLRHAHVVARRIASVLKHTMLRPDDAQAPIAPSVTLATMKSSDNIATLMARVAGGSVLAAE
jgi:GGDEF domain-containing protein